MKKILCIVIALVMIISVFSACSATQTSESAATTTEAATTAATTTEAATTAATTTEDAATEEAVFDPSDYPISINMPVVSHPVHRIVQYGFMIKAEELGYPAEIIGVPDGGTSETVALTEQAIGKGIKGIALWAGEPGFYPVIKQASDVGVKIVVPMFKIPEGTSEGLLANICADPEVFAIEVAKAMGEKLAGKTGSIAITSGSYNTLENANAETFTKYIEENYPNLTVLERQEEGFDPPAAIAKAVSIIQANPDIIGAYSTTGGGPITWAGAMDQTNRSDLVCIGMDYTEQNCDLVKEGKIYAIVAQPLYEQTMMCVEILDKLFRGEPVPYFTRLEAPVVTVEGIDKYAELNETVKAYFK